VGIIVVVKQEQVRGLGAGGGAAKVFFFLFFMNSIWAANKEKAKWAK
jgi:hypothetical protein